jgi:hypothetical protein
MANIAFYLKGDSSKLKTAQVCELNYSKRLEDYISKERKVVPVQGFEELSHG